jgi:thymidylate synthase (FAD)
VKVVLIASTVVDWEKIDDTPWVAYENDGEHFHDWVYDADDLAEFAGRACYESWNRPNPATNTNATYLEHILEVGHESVLEHASASFYVTGVSRSLLAELTRHRHLSFSVRSQRFVDESNPIVVTPPAIVEDFKARGNTTQLLLDAATDRAIGTYRELVGRLTAAGLARKQAREAARSVLPQATETRFVVTGNMRAWREVIKKRLHPQADAEIRELAAEILRQLAGLAPSTFQDFDCEERVPTAPEHHPI